MRQRGTLPAPPRSSSRPASTSPADDDPARPAPTEPSVAPLDRSDMPRPIPVAPSHLAVCEPHFDSEKPGMVRFPPQSRRLAGMPFASAKAGGPNTEHDTLGRRDSFIGLRFN